MPSARAYREVVPNDSVFFEEVLEALRESQLSTAVEAREAQARDQGCHVTTERLNPARPRDQRPRCSSGTNYFHSAARGLSGIVERPSHSTSLKLLPSSEIALI